MYGRNQTNIVKQLSVIKKKKTSSSVPAVVVPWDFSIPLLVHVRLLQPCALNFWYHLQHKGTREQVLASISTEMLSVTPIQAKAERCPRWAARWGWRDGGLGSTIPSLLLIPGTFPGERLSSWNAGRMKTPTLPSASPPAIKGTAPQKVPGWFHFPGSGCFSFSGSMTPWGIANKGLPIQSLMGGIQVSTGGLECAQARTIRH